MFTYISLILNPGLYGCFAFIQYCVKIKQEEPYNSSYPIAKAYQQHTPIIIEDLQTAATTGMIEPDNRLVTTGAHGYVCVPLWFGDHFEGTLTATFKEPIHSDSPE